MSFFKQFPEVNYDIALDGTVSKMVNIFRSVRPVQTFIDDPSLYQYYTIQNGERPDVVSQKLYGTPDFYWTFFVINEFLHDGYKVWPMSQEQLYKYIETEYNGYAVNTKIYFIENDIQNSLAGKFEIGEIIEGSRSGAKGILKKKDIDLNQLVIQDMIVDRSFDGILVSENTETEFENIAGAKSFDSVETYQVWPYAEAPHHYYKTEDGVEREYSNRIFFENNIENTTDSQSDNQLNYVSNRQYVNELNDQRSKIRVINPTVISEFIDNFERLINE